MSSPRAERWGWSLCVAGAAVGALALLGWMVGAQHLTEFVPGRPPMMPNTAVALLLIGLAGALRQHEGAGRLKRMLSLLATLCVAAIGVVTLLESALGVDWLLDRSLLPSEGGPVPSGVSPPTALALTLLAGALLLFDVRARAGARPSEWLILLAGVTALAGLSGHILGAGPLEGLDRPRIIDLALSTSIGLLLISSGLLLERPRAGVMRVATSPGPGGILLRRLVPAAVLAPVLFAVVDTELAALLGIEDHHVVIAVLTTTMAVVLMVLLTVTAVRLNRSHAALESSSAWTQSLLDKAPDGIFVADLDGRYTDVNDAGCRMLGYSGEEIVGKTILDLIPPEQTDHLWRSKQQMLGGAIAVDEWTLRRKDGSYLPVEVSASILPDGRWMGFVRDISERRRLEEALQLSEARYRGILAVSADAIISIDEEQRITLFNEGAERAFGYSRAEAMGAPLDMLIPERFRAAHREHVERFAASSDVARMAGGRNVPIVGLRKNGEEFPADASISRLELGGARLLTAALRDVSERKRAEDALRASEERYRTLFESMDQGFCVIEVLFDQADRAVDFRYLEVNPAFEEEAGLANPVGRRVREVVPGLEEHWFDLYGRVALTGEPRRSENRVAVLDRFYEISAFRIGRPEARQVAVLFKDVSDRKRVERAQRILADVGPLFAASLDYEDTLTRIAEVTTRHLADFCIVDLVDDDGGLHRLRVAGRDPSRAEICRRLQGIPIDGTSPHLVWSALRTREPMFWQRSSPASIGSLSQSEEHIEALVAAEPESVMVVPLVVQGKLVGAFALLSSQHLGRTDLELAQEIARRAALAVENARLYRAAQRAIQARDDVLGVVAHDLRNPLGAILVSVDLVRHGGDPERGRRSADAIERAALRMNRLIQDLLDVVHLEAGGLTIEQSQLSAAAIVSEAVEAQAEHASAKSLALRIDMADDIPPLWADRDRLLQVLENLIGNALKFTEPGGCVVVGAAPRDREVVFWVVDTGIGIAEKDHEHVFDRFWQARGGRRRGAGLGLPIVKGLVEAHGGRIWFESKPGRGSTFYFTIPTPPRAEAWQAEPPP